MVAAQRLPHALRQRLSEAGVDFKKQTLSVGSEGRFEMRGLDASFVGRLVLPEGLALVREPAGTCRGIGPGKQHLVLMEPRTGLQVHAAHLPWVRGRAVWSGTGDAAAGVELVVLPHFADLGQSQGHMVTTDADGRFARALQHSTILLGNHFSSLEVDSVQVGLFQLRIPGKRMNVTTFLAKQMAADGDVGDVEIPAHLALRYVVVDEAGEPVSGARAGGVADGRPLRSHWSTDPKGNGCLLLALEGEVELPQRQDSVGAS